MAEAGKDPHKEKDRITSNKDGLNAAAGSSKLLQWQNAVKQNKLSYIYLSIYLFD